MTKILMCKPQHFQVTYEINPWMHVGSVDSEKAMLQWDNLVEVYRQVGVEVEVIDQVEGLPDMVFAVDQGIAHDNKFLQSSFRYRERQGETPHYQAWLESHGLVIETLPKGVFFEGGDIRRAGNTVYVGCGFRTDCEAAEHISRIQDAETVQLHLIDPRYYHLDTCFFPVNDNTAFYFPAAFKPESLSELQARFSKLIEISDVEAANFAANGVSLALGVLVQSYNPQMAKVGRDLGLNVIEVDISEFMKAGGGINCLTLPLSI